MARTWNSVPAMAFAGTTTARSYGSTVTVEASAPFTSKRTDTTPTLSMACASAVTFLPGSDSDGNDSVTMGGVTSATVTENGCVAVPPRASVTISVTGNGPSC